jgi:dihydrofolate reductase
VPPALPPHTVGAGDEVGDLAAGAQVVLQLVSVDGVGQGPGAPDEDTTDGFTQGGWFVPHLDESFLKLVTGWVDDADAFLFGRRTYEALPMRGPRTPTPMTRWPRP